MSPIFVVRKEYPRITVDLRRVSAIVVTNEPYAIVDGAVISYLDLNTAKQLEFEWRRFCNLERRSTQK